MFCDMCNLDCSFYQCALRWYEGVKVCLYCYLDINDAGINDFVVSSDMLERRRAFETTFHVDLAHVA